mgnify:CR=1 FL=1
MCSTQPRLYHFHFFSRNKKKGKRKSTAPYRPKLNPQLNFLTLFHCFSEQKHTFSAKTGYFVNKKQLKPIKTKEKLFWKLYIIFIKRKDNAQSPLFGPLLGPKLAIISIFSIFGRFECFLWSFSFNELVAFVPVKSWLAWFII